MNEDNLSVRVGAAVLVALAIAVVLVLLLAGRHFGPGVHVHVAMDRVGNLQVGAKVRMAGLELGEVQDIRLVGAPSAAIIDLWIYRRNRWLVTTTSDFFMSQEGMLGEPYLGLAPRPGEPGPPLAEGATVRGIDPPRIDHLLITIDESLRGATNLMRDGIPEGVALGFQLDALSATLDSFESPRPAWLAAVRLAFEARTLSAAVPPNTPARLRAAADSLRLPDLSPRLDRLRAALDRIAARTNDPRLTRFVEALAQAGTLVDRAQHARAMAEDLQRLVSSGRGTLGALLQDVELADEMKDMMRTMKRQPWVTIGKPQK